MEELLHCALTEVADGLLCNVALEVGVDPAKGKTLSRCAATVLEGIAHKASIVAVVVEDADAMLLGKVLKRALSFHGLSRGNLGHQVDVLELGVVVDKDRGCGVLLLGE
jgi:hypothetical protein